MRAAQLGELLQCSWCGVCCAAGQVFLLSRPLAGECGWWRAPDWCAPPLASKVESDDDNDARTAIARPHFSPARKRSFPFDWISLLPVCYLSDWLAGACASAATAPPVRNQQRINCNLLLTNCEWLEKRARRRHRAYWTFALGKFYPKQRCDERLHQMRQTCGPDLNGAACSRAEMSPPCRRDLIARHPPLPPLPPVCIATRSSRQWWATAGWSQAPSRPPASPASH